MTLHCLFCLFHYNVVIYFELLWPQCSYICQMQNQHRHWMCWTSTAKDSVSRTTQCWNSWCNSSGWPIQSKYNILKPSTLHMCCIWSGGFAHCSPYPAVWYDRQWHIVSTVDTHLWTMRPVIIYWYPSQPFWLDRLFQYQYTVYALPLLSSQG